jgi:hypothetical protein
MHSASLTATGEAQRRRRLRRSALLWALVAVGFYAGFIVLTLLRWPR